MGAAAWGVGGVRVWFQAHTADPSRALTQSLNLLTTPPTHCLPLPLITHEMTNDKLGLETKPTASQLAPKHPLPSYIGARTIVGKNGERGPARRVPLPSVPPPYAQRKDALPPLHHTTQAPSTKRPPVGLSRPPPPKRRADESEVATPPERRVWPLTQHAMARHNAEATKEAEPAPWVFLGLILSLTRTARRHRPRLRGSSSRALRAWGCTPPLRSTRRTSS